MAFTIAILVFALLAYYYVTMHGQGGEATVGPLHINVKDDRMMTLFDKKGNILAINFAISIPETAMYEECEREDQSLCYWWRNTTVDIEYAMAQMEVKVHEPQENNIQCIDVKWKALLFDHSPQDCISFDNGGKSRISNSHWYGGGEAYNMVWPMEKLNIPMKPFVSKDLVQDQEAFGSVLERYWLNSLGIAVLVSEDTPLHVSVDPEQMCFKAEYLNSPFQNTMKKNPTLEYTLCIGSDMRTTHEYVMNKYFSHPIAFPDERMFTHPIWSTWARYKTNVNQSSVLQFAKEILDHGFNNSQIEIDDMYTTSHGEINFSPKKFPNPKDMVSKLHDMGFRVTTWVHPFANIGSPAFIEGTENSYFLTDPTGEVPALVKWWNGVGATLDTTNSKANDWFVDRLHKLQTDYGIDSFKFDAGEAQYVPLHYNASIPFTDPNLYCLKYVQTAKRLGKQIEVRCGHKSQEFPIFVRMMDKDSNWSSSNGLRTLIPSTLVMGLLGYPYILPDMIGGNCYDPVTIFSQYLPDRELYIRWMELTAYLPSMQFSVAPWQYDPDVVSIAQDMTRIHSEVVTPLIMGLIKDAIGKGELIAQN